MQRRDFYFLLPLGIALIAAITIELILSGRGPILLPARSLFSPVSPIVSASLPGHGSRAARQKSILRMSPGAGSSSKRTITRQRRPSCGGFSTGSPNLTLVEPDASRSADWIVDAAAAGQPALIALRGRAGNIVAEAVVAPAPAAAAAVGNAVYVRQSGAERASLARGSVELPGDLLGWLDRGIIDLPQSRIASLTLTGADGAMLAIRRDSPDAAFAIADLPEGARLKTDAGLSELTGALAELAFDDVKPLALVELPESGLARAAFVTFDGLTIDLRLFAQEGADWVAIACSGTGAAEAESNALNDKLARWIYAIPAARSKLLRTRLDDLTEPVKGL